MIQIVLSKTFFKLGVMLPPTQSVLLLFVLCFVWGGLFCLLDLLLLFFETVLKHPKQNLITWNFLRRPRWP